MSGCQLMCSGCLAAQRAGSLHAKPKPHLNLFPSWLSLYVGDSVR